MLTALMLDIKKYFAFCFALLAISFFINSYAAVSDNVAATSKLKWQACKTNPQFLCSNISVPLDYKHPQLGNIKLPVSMHPATQTSRGYLLFNFGGPWANNVKVLPSITSTRLTQTMIKQFDLVVINPRGVSPNIIQCHAKEPTKLKEINQAMKKIFAQGNVKDAEALYDLAKQKQGLCRYNKLYENASTANTVKDVDGLRKALHVQKLNFYMNSYGTRLGLAYVVEYPQHVQRMILDGNIAPSNQLMSIVGGRAFGAVTTFNAFFHYCFEAGSKCPLNNLISNKRNKSSSGLINRFNKLLIKASQNQGIPTNLQYANRPITSGMVENLMYIEMQPSHWNNLAKALYEAETKNSGSALMKIYRASTGYNPKTNSYSIVGNTTRRAVICEDYVIPDFNKKAVWLDFINQIHVKYSQIGTVATLWLTPVCINWHVKSTPLLPKPPNVFPNSKNASPQVLIIGNSKDPMTPFENAVAVRNYLNQFNIKSILLKWNSVSHTALMTDSPLSACVFHNVDMFLLDQYRSTTITCNDWQNPFLKLS